MTPFVFSIWYVSALVAAAACLTALLIAVLRPQLQRYALARPNARSSHKVPTPQGGGIAIVMAILVVAAASFLLARVAPVSGLELSIVAAATILVALVGTVDDIRTLDVAPRLLLQTLAVAAVLWTIPADIQIVPFAPFWLERLVLLVGGVWFVNLVNFMDGLDWMTVAETVPMAGALAVLGMMGALPAYAVVVALALLGGMLGFAPFNRPVARLFLGDVGSLPIGLLLGWLLLLLAGDGNLTAALLLPLYYLADATITLLRRLFNGEHVFQAHRSHFYQRAADRGMPVTRIVGYVFAANIVLGLLAAIAMTSDAATTKAIALGCGVLLVTALLWFFEKGRV